jgi:ATP-dependent protease ClpP protease subunit
MNIFENELEGVKIASIFIDDETPIQVVYEGDITSNFIQIVMVELTQYSDILKNTGFDFYLNSGGGDATNIKIAPKFFKKLGMKSITGLGQASSAALAILLESKKHRMPVYVDALCHIVLHKSMTMGTMETRSKHLKYFLDEWPELFEKEFDSINSSLIKKMTVNRKKRYEDGHNIYFIGKELIEKKVFKDYNEKE